MIYPTVPRFWRFIVTVAILGCSATAQTNPDVEIVLVPFISRTPGALGTIWQSDLLVGNPLDRDVFLVLEGPCTLSSDVCYEAEHLEARSVELIAHDRFDNPSEINPSVVVFVERGFPQRLSWLLRTRDVNGDPGRFGTQVPVAFDRDFRIEPIEIIGIPTTPRYRQNLWIWDPDGTNLGKVRVSVLREDTNDLLGESEVSLAHGISRPDVTTFFQRPSFGQILGVAATFPLASTTERVKIRIEPTTPSLRYWAAVFVVDNETQEVSVIAPH